MAEAAEVERPSGSFVSVTNDGFTIESNTGTEDELRAQLGIAKKPAAEKLDEFEAQAEKLPAQEFPTRAKLRRDPSARRQSLQAEIDADVERKRVAKEAADAEETRLTKVREEARTYQPPRPIEQPSPRAADVAKPNGQAPPVYDGSDPADPEPTLNAFANDPSGDPYTAWLLARQAHTTRVEWRKQQHAQTQTEQRKEADTVYRSRVGALQEKVKAHTTKDAEFQKKIDPAVASYLKWTTPDEQGVPLGDLVMDAPNTTDLLIYFSDNKPELARISALPSLQQAMEFGQIQGMLKAQTIAPASKPKAISQAKPLIPRVEGTAAPNADDRSDEELSDEEHDARYRKIRRQYR